MRGLNANNSLKHAACCTAISCRCLTLLAASRPRTPLASHTLHAHLAVSLVGCNFSTFLSVRVRLQFWCHATMRHSFIPFNLATLEHACMQVRSQLARTIESLAAEHFLISKRCATTSNESHTILPHRASSITSLSYCNVLLHRMQLSWLLACCRAAVRDAIDFFGSRHNDVHLCTLT